MYISSDYKDKVLGRPNQLIDPKKKDRKYYLDCMKYYYSMYVNDKCSVLASDWDWFDEMRSYLRGNQSEEKYKSWAADDFLSQAGFSSDASGSEVSLDTDGVWNAMGTNSNQLREGWMNVQWRPLTPMPKIVRAMTGMFKDADYDIYVDFVDEESVFKQKKKKYESYYRTKEKDFIEQYSRVAGIPTQEPDYMPEDLQDLNDAEEAGVFKLDSAIPFEELVKYTYDKSEWSDLKIDLILDLASVRTASTVDYFDENIAEWRTKYVDPKYFIAQYTTHSKFKDSDYMGHVELRSLSSIRQSLLNEGYSYKELEEELQGAAHTFSGMFGNPSADSWGAANVYQPDYGTWGFDDYQIPVMCMQWKDIEVKRYKKTNLKRGGTKIEDLDYDYEPDAQTTKDIQKGYVNINDTYIRKGKKATWVLGTENLIFDWGDLMYMKRNSEKDVELNYHAVQLNEISIVEQIYPLLDQLQFAWLKYQNSIATSLEPTTAIDMGMIANLYNGKNNADPMQVLKFMRQTGVLPFMNSPTGRYQGGTGQPIHQIQGGMGTRLQEFVSTIEILMAQIQSYTGISDMTTGSKPQEGTAVGIAEMTMQGSSNVLRPLIDGALRIKEMGAPTIVKRIVDGIGADKTISDAYEKVIGNSGVVKIKEAIKNNVEFSFTFVGKPDAYEKQQFLATLADAYNAGKSGGKNGLFFDAYTRILELFNAGTNLKKLYKITRSEVRRYTKQMQQEAMQNIQAQTQANDQSAARASELKQKEIQGDYLGKAALEEQKSNNEIKRDRENARLDRGIGLNKPDTEQQMNPNQPMQPQPNTPIDNQNMPV